MPADVLPRSKSRLPVVRQLILPLLIIVPGWLSLQLHSYVEESDSYGLDLVFVAVAGMTARPARWSWPGPGSCCVAGAVTASAVSPIRLRWSGRSRWWSSDPADRTSETTASRSAVGSGHPATRRSGHDTRPPGGPSVVQAGERWALWLRNWVSSATDTTAPSSVSTRSDSIN